MSGLYSVWASGLFPGDKRLVFDNLFPGAWVCVTQVCYATGLGPDLHLFIGTVEYSEYKIFIEYVYFLLIGKKTRNKKPLIKTKKIKDILFFLKYQFIK